MLRSASLHAGDNSACEGGRRCWFEGVDSEDCVNGGGGPPDGATACASSLCGTNRDDVADGIPDDQDCDSPGGLKPVLAEASPA